jgi:hypothetical protein
MSKEERFTRMIDLVSQWRKSGMSQAEFSAANNITIHTFKYWLYKVETKKDKSSGKRFIQLNSMVAPQDVFIIRYPNGVELHSPVQVSVAVLKSLITH